MSARSPITTHVLDTATGRPAAGVPVTLTRQTDEGWNLVGSGVTNEDGRIADLVAPGSLSPGTYQIRFETAEYFEKIGVERYFYPFVEVTFVFDAPEQHYHVPLLVSPFGFSTYRGS